MVLFANLFVGLKKQSSEYDKYACGCFLSPPRPWKKALIYDQAPGIYNKVRSPYGEEEDAEAGKVGLVREYTVKKDYWVAKSALYLYHNKILNMARLALFGERAGVLVPAWR